ncbi:MAG: ArsA family ATPase [Leptolyngbyaceae cyanobacterium MO_188.B28]|nr:ArsA family ATPase [Leptolyngbyaceae cyanobacterium MO_188.B28]
MALILTFLGKGGTGKTITAIAAAKKFASQGKRVLLASQDPEPVLSLLLETSLTPDPISIADNLWAVHLQATAQLERNWEELKKLEAQYLRTPFFKAVYGQELGVLPGMDSALALNAIREYDASNRYDVIVYDGADAQTSLRMWGIPEILDWYLRRFRDVLADSDLAKALSPFVQPIANVILAVNSSGDVFDQPTSQVTQLLERGREAISDPGRVLTYLVTTADPLAIATARHLWGGAQQVGLTVGGVILNQSEGVDLSGLEFEPLPVSPIPTWEMGEWDSLIESLPDFTDSLQAPRPVTVDLTAGKVSLFLPGFSKNQVKLTQYGPELTIEAGDQRRNLFLPAELKGRQVKGAKFQDGYLVISF